MVKGGLKYVVLEPASLGSRLKTGRRSGKRLAVSYLRQGKFLFIIKFQPPFALCVSIELA